MTILLQLLPPSPSSSFFFFVIKRRILPLIRATHVVPTSSAIRTGPPPLRGPCGVGRLGALTREETPRSERSRPLPALTQLSTGGLSQEPERPQRQPEDVDLGAVGCTEVAPLSDSGTGVSRESPTRVWGTRTSEPSAHSCSGRSQPPP